MLKWKPSWSSAQTSARTMASGAGTWRMLSSCKVGFVVRSWALPMLALLLQTGQLLRRFVGAKLDVAKNADDLL